MHGACHGSHHKSFPGFTDTEEHWRFLVKMSSRGEPVKVLEYVIEKDHLRLAKLIKENLNNHWRDKHWKQGKK